MTITRFKTFWLILLAVSSVANTSIQAIFKSWTKSISRKWVDEAIQKWVTKIIKLLRIHPKVINVSGSAPKPGQPTIVMCNHSSLFDIPLSFLAFPQHSMRMLAKKELARVPLMGRAMVAAEFPFVDRKNRHQSIQDLEKVRHLLSTGIVMWIAPEGTRSATGKLGAFKKGGFITAIQAGATIIPVGIRGAYEILPARTFQLNTDQHAEIHVGQPIDASEFTLANKEELIAKVHQAMQELVGDKH